MAVCGKYNVTKWQTEGTYVRSDTLPNWCGCDGNKKKVRS